MIDRIGRQDPVTYTVAAQHPNLKVGLKVGWHLVPHLVPCTLFLPLFRRSADARRRPAAVARRDRRRYK